jgi:hypothetical protein
MVVFWPAICSIGTVALGLGFRYLECRGRRMLQHMFRDDTYKAEVCGSDLFVKSLAERDNVSIVYGARSTAILRTKIYHST